MLRKVLTVISLFCLTSTVNGALTIKQLPSIPLLNGALRHTVGANSSAGVRISNPQPMSRSINLWFPVVQTDESAPSVNYSIDWTQPNGSKTLPQNLRWNAFNIGDLYWQPANTQEGLHQFTVTATSGVESISISYKINVIGSTSTVPLLNDNSEIKAYFFSPTSNSTMTAVTQNGVTEPYTSWLVYPATHCVWYADISGSGGSFSQGDYGINYIGQTGGARSAAWILTPSGQNQINALINYCMLSRSNYYVAWPSQTPNFSSDPNFNFSRYVADTNAVVGAGEGRYQATAAFKDTFYKLFNGLSPDLRKRIVNAGHFIPTYQVALRRSQALATGYIDDPKAHPTVFTSTLTTTDLARVDAFVTAMNTANVLLPISTVSVLSEDWKLPYEDLHSVDRSIARTWYGYNKITGIDRERHMRVDARQSFVPNGVLKQIHWKILETGGGNDSVEINSLNPQNTVVDLTIRYPKGNKPIKIGVFAEADSAQPDAVRFSAPSFLTFSPWSDLDESRGSDIDNNTQADAAYVRLTGYDGYNIYDKREYRVYDTSGRLLKRSSGGRAQLWRHWNSLVGNPGDHKEDVFEYDVNGNMTGFQRRYSNSFETFGHAYTADGIKIITKDSNGKVLTGEFQKQQLGLPERATARITFDYPLGTRRTSKIEHLTYLIDSAHTTDRRYDVPSVQYVNTFSADGDIQLSRGVSPTVIEGVAKFSPGMIDGYKPGSTTPDFSTVYNGEFETLADALQIVSANIMQPPIVTITITPSNVPSLSVGSTIQLVAKITGIPNGVPSWSVYNTPPVVSTGSISISSTGLVTGLKAGTDYAVASFANGPQIIQAFCRIVVVDTAQPPVVTTVTITPSSSTIEIGNTVQLTAIVKDQYGNTMNGVVVNWSSSNNNIGNVSATGLVSGLSVGQITVTASAGVKTGSAIVTVIPETKILTKNEILQLLGQSLQKTVSDIILLPDGTYKITFLSP